MPAQETMTTQLEAINTMLGCVGEAPIDSLLGSLTANIQLAVNLLKDTSRDLQASSWNFNSETDFAIIRDINGYCTLPGNTLDVDLSTEAGDIEVVQRGLRLYDKQNHTFVFTSDQKVDITLFLPWDDLNEPARNVIKIRAARQFQDRTVGSHEHHQYFAADEATAFAAFVGSDTRNEDATIFDNWDIASIITRRRVRTSAFF